MDQRILIDKPTKMTSFGVVARVRRRLTEELNQQQPAASRRRVKVGHTGTLDPFASGLMILLTGKKCKEAGHYSKLDKTYEAEIVLGQTSSTGDPEGEIVQTSSRVPTFEEMQSAAEKFVGKIWQTPPIYSAIKVGGERAYKLARRGESVEMPKRQVTIYSLEVLNYDYPVLKITAAVSSGTYIRTLAEDIGAELGTGAYCRSLRRTRVGEFHLEEASQLEDLGILS